MQIRISQKPRTYSVITILGILIIANQTLASGMNFVDPSSWNINDTGTTYQEWETLINISNNTPDIGLIANPTISSIPSLDATPPGFVTSSGNFYSFTTDYGFTANIYNHGGPSGNGNFADSHGTHVIIQTSTTLNGGNGVYTDSMEIVDLHENNISGGSNANSLRHDILFEGITNSSFGPVTLREEIWEFFLPDHLDDFRIQADSIVHSSLMQLRIDTAVTQSAFPITVIPEPTAITFLISGGMVFSGFRRRKI